MKNQNIVKSFSLLLLFMSITLQAQQKITVLEIDTGVDLKKHLALYDHISQTKIQNSDDYIDLQSHGTHIAGIIIKDTCKEVELISCRYYIPSDTPSERDERYYNCLKRAVVLKPYIVNFSSGGEEPLKNEYQYLKQLEQENVIFVTAAGNFGENLTIFNYFPAKYNLTNMIVVGNLLPNGKYNPTSNYGLLGMKWMVGTNIYSTIPNGLYGFKTGTSMSAAAYSNKLLLEKCHEIHKQDN